MEKDQVLRGVLVGAFIVVGSWKSYLVFRNLLMLRDMPNPPPELEINQVEYDKMQLMTQYQTEQILMIIIVETNIRVAKLVLNYFPYIWKLSGKMTSLSGENSVQHAMFFASLDNCIAVAVAIPIVFLSALLDGGGNPLRGLIDQLVEMAYRGIVAALGTYIVIYITDNYGVSSILKCQLTLNILGIFAMAFYYQFMMSLDHEHLPDNSIGSSVTALASEVGYPTNTIYVDKRSPEPNAYYSSAIFAKIIIITESLLSSLEPSQVAGVVAHELGHWKYCHPCYTYLGQTMEIVAMGFVWIFAYGNTELIKGFQLDPSVHPFIPVYLSFYFIWPPFNDLFRGIFNLLKTRFEFVADDYACDLWSPKILRQALVKISTRVKTFPLLDSWFAAWFIGHPSILERVRRIDIIIENQ